MKVVVSTIMRDEPVEFIERWAKSAQDADELVLTDTGTTKTEAIACARDLGVVVHEITVRPWRFDVARNAAMALLPGDADVMVTLDSDEILAPGWRDALEGAGPRPQYQYEYVWSWAEHDDSEPDVWFYADRTVSRHGWRWKHPVHETLVWCGDGAPSPFRVGMRIEHHPDHDKSRADYLPLLAQAVAEDPSDDRMAHYYARELFFRGDWVRAREEFVRHLSLPSARWPAERAQSYRYIAKMDSHPERWLLKAVAEDPNRREAWAELALHWSDRDTGVAAGYAQRALQVPASGGDYMVERWAQGDGFLQALAGGGV